MENAAPDDASAPAPPAEIEQRALWYEEFYVGARYLHRPGRTITEADNILFSNITGNAQALHLDSHFAASQPFGPRERALPRGSAEPPKTAPPATSRSRRPAIQSHRRLPRGSFTRGSPPSGPPGSAAPRRRAGVDRR